MVEVWARLEVVLRHRADPVPGGGEEGIEYGAVISDEPASPTIKTYLPSRIKSAPKCAELSLLLFCPEQGGWHTGEWVAETGDWRSVISWDDRLQPTHWMSVPSEPFNA